MPELDEISTRLDEELRKRLADGRVTGASVAVLSGGRVADAAAGYANRRAGIEATPDTLFQIGSITKIWTTTLVMRLVDEGRVDLDEPVASYVPGFTTADPEAAARITVRQLLTHTSGFRGDVFKDTGRNPDAVARYIAEILPNVPQTLPPGRLFSYNNAGFSVLGRIVELMRGTTWAQAVHAELAEPLGVTVATDAYEAILHRSAVGHVAAEHGGAPDQVVAEWGLHSSNAPAGSMLSMSARDLLAFARLHIDGGITPSGERLLSAESVAAMRVRQVDVPRRTSRALGIGLGWHLFDWDGGTVIGHDGGTIGQAAMLRLVPERGIAVAMLTNGGDPLGVMRGVLGPVLEELAGVRVPPALGRPDAGARVERPERYAGSYASGLDTYVVTVEDGRLWLDTVPGEDLGHLAPRAPRQELLACAGVGADVFMAVDPDGDGPGMTVAFVGEVGGRAEFLHNHRANPRVGGGGGRAGSARPGPGWRVPRAIGAVALSTGLSTGCPQGCAQAGARVVDRPWTCRWASWWALDRLGPARDAGPGGESDSRTGGSVGVFDRFAR